ncbi:phytanoyl-CoA dioxygenase family protein [Gammaproteobacteria bacterium]|nr:phytanoyl-CoA dioxygenase family protein [Gammaproteobacteria bacterium]
MEPIQEFNAEHSLPSNDARLALRSDGVVCLRGAHDDEWLSLVEEGIEQALSGASEDVDIVEKSGDSGRFSFSSQAWRQVDAFRQAIIESRSPDIGFSLLGTDSMNLFYDFLLIKEAGTANANTPWHQDHAYYPLHGVGVINCWTALDPIPMETALRFWAGSHREACIYQAANFAGDTNYRHARSDRPVIPDIDDDPAARILTAALQPGDMLAWDSYTFHSAPGNTLNRRRAAFSINWASDAISFHDIPCLASYRAPELTEGSSITCDKFPLVRGK